MGKTISWSKESVLVLIQAWEQFECLYDQRNEFYHNRQARNNALDIIAKELKDQIPNITSNDIRTKINFLRTQYCRELSKIKDSCKSDGYEEIYTPTAYWFEQLTFLKEHINIKKGISSVPVVVDVDMGDITFEEVAPVPTGSAKRIKKNEACEIPLEDDLLLQAKGLMEKISQPSSDRYNDGLLLFLEENIREIEDEGLRDELSENIISIVMEYKRKQRRKNARTHWSP